MRKNYLFGIFILFLIFPINLKAQNLTSEDLNLIAIATKRYILMTHHVQGFYPDRVITEMCTNKEKLILRLVEAPYDNREYEVFVDKLFTSVRFNKDFLSSPTGFGIYFYPDTQEPVKNVPVYSEEIAKFKKGLAFTMQMDEDDFWLERKPLPLGRINKVLSRDIKQLNLKNGSYIYISKTTEKMPWIYFYDVASSDFGEYLYNFKNGDVITSDLNNAENHPVVYKQAASVIKDGCLYKYKDGKIFDLSRVDKLKKDSREKKDLNDTLKKIEMEHH